MKTRALLIITTLISLSVGAQTKWAPYASIEENIHFSDISPSYRYINLSVPAANSGIRLGAHYVHDNQLSAELTLGVVGIGTPGSFSSKIVPVEVVGHYNVIDGIELPIISKFNLDLGVGSGLAEYSNGNFGFSEHIVSGASMELPDVVPFGTLIMGIRYTSFIDDYIDGTVVSGSSKDGVLRFYTAVRLDGASKKLTTALKEAEATAEKLKSNLANKELSSAEEIKKAEKEIETLKAEKTALSDELDALKTSQAEQIEDVQDESLTTITKVQYQIVIGSFPSQEMAESYASTIKLKTSISNVSDLNTYRVVLSQHDDISSALSALEKAREITPRAWIAVK